MGFTTSILKMDIVAFDDSIIKQNALNWIEEHTFSEGIQISKNPNKDGKYVVDAIMVSIKHDVDILANEWFVWGTIENDFICYNTQITSLEGAPQSVTRDFLCNYCQKLISLKGSPEFVGGNFFCNGTSIRSFDGISKTIKGILNYSDTLIKYNQNTKKELEKICNIKIIGQGTPYTF